jgi:hypothetical protein
MRARRDAGGKSLQTWPRRRVFSWALMLAGVVVAAQHLLAHAGLDPLPLSMGWQDLAVGYPMAGLLVVAGALLVDPNPV